MIISLRSMNQQKTKSDFDIIIQMKRIILHFHGIN
jgi:hypothetical protein